MVSLFHILSVFQESEYKKLGEELLTAAWRTLNSPDWKLEKKLDNGDMVQVVLKSLLETGRTAEKWCDIGNFCLCSGEAS